MCSRRLPGPDRVWEGDVTSSPPTTRAVNCLCDGRHECRVTHAVTTAPGHGCCFIVQSASKTIGMTLPAGDELYETCDQEDNRHVKRHFSVVTCCVSSSVAKSGCRHLYDSTHQLILPYLPANLHQAAQREMREGDVNGEEGRGR